MLRQQRLRGCHHTLPSGGQVSQGVSLPQQREKPQTYQCTSSEEELMGDFWSVAISQPFCFHHPALQDPVVGAGVLERAVATKLTAWPESAHCEASPLTGPSRERTFSSPCQPGLQGPAFECTHSDKSSRQVGQSLGCQHSSWTPSVSSVSLNHRGK